jgi:hypothetical protein
MQILINSAKVLNELLEIVFQSHNNHSFNVHSSQGCVSITTMFF